MGFIHVLRMKNTIRDTDLKVQESKYCTHNDLCCCRQVYFRNDALCWYHFKNLSKNNFYETSGKLVNMRLLIMTCSNIKPTRSTGPAEVSQNRLLFDRPVKFLSFSQTDNLCYSSNSSRISDQAIMNHHTQIQFFKRIIQETHFDEILK